MVMNVVLAGGGTGGHLVPGINLADGIRVRWPEARIAFFISGRPVEKRLLADRYESHVLPSPNGSGWRRALTGARAVPAAFLRAYRAFLRHRPLAFVGLGGYTAIPAALAARSLHVPIFLLEQNVLPGRATRCLSAMAAEIHCQWPDTLAHLADRSRAFASGTPLRPDLDRPRPDEAYRQRGLEPGRPTLLVMGGSQGACGIDDAVVGALEHLELGRDWQAIHLTGAGSEQRVRAAYREKGLPHYVAAFEHDMPSLFGLTDLVLARAGGTTCAELAALGLPAVFVPYPWHKDRHQFRNAQSLGESCGDVWVDQSALTPVCFQRLVLGLLRDAERRNLIGQKLRHVMRRDATQTICQSLGRLETGPHGASARWAYPS